MRKILIFFIFVLAACAPVAPNVTVTSIPKELIIPSPPLIVTATPESWIESGTATLETPGYLDLLNINWSDQYEGSNWNGISILQINVGVDYSLHGRASGLEFKDATGNKILGQKALQMLWALFVPESKGAVDGLDGFAQALADIKAGKKVDPTLADGTKLKIFDANGSGPAEEMWLVPDTEGKDVPTGAYEVKSFKIVYGDWSKLDGDTGKQAAIGGTPWFKLMGNYGGNGAGIMFDKATGELVILIGIEDSGSTGLERRFSTATELAIDWLVAIAQGRSMSSIGSVDRWDVRGDVWTGQLEVKQ